MAQDSPSVPFRFVLRTLLTITFIDVCLKPTPPPHLYYFIKLIHQSLNRAISSMLQITVRGNTKSMGTRALQEATSGAAAVGSISH